MADDMELDIDEQEMGEREEASKAYADEDETHYVDYCISCAEESRRARKDILDNMSLLWDAYLNSMDFGDKEDWQSQVITNKPFTAVERAVSIIRKAFKNPNYITTSGVELGDRDISEDAKKAMSYWVSHRNVDFPFVFSNASRMAMAVGQSLEVIPRWETGMILDWTEPWKILRDPDALPGKPWSGSYWIHEEWIDKWKLEEGGKDGYYINTDRIVEGGKESGTEVSKEELERRKRQYWDRSNYRKAVLVREFNGVVLDRQGSLLLPNAKYTIAGQVLIRRPSVIPFVNIRWPGSSFSPIPHVIRFDGRGIVEGIFELWKMLNKMLSLSMDDFSWVVNRMREVFPELLLDPTDLDFYPGKDVFRSTDFIEQPAVRDLLAKSNMSDLLAFAQYIGTNIDNGDFVTEFVQGLPGSRSQITKGEVELKTEQNMGIFDSIGTEVEHGAVNIAYAMYETMVLNWNSESNPSPTRVLGPNNTFARFLEEAPLDVKKQFLTQDCDIKIVGISSQIEMAEKVKLLMAMKAYTESPVFAPFMKPKELLDETVGAMGMYKAPFIKSEQEMMEEEAGKQLVGVLGKLAASGGPEVQSRIQQFIQSLMAESGNAPQAPTGGGIPPAQVGGGIPPGMGPEMAPPQGGNGGMGAPVPPEPAV